MRLIHRSLVCLGDLARYKLELDPYWDPLIAKRYYKMAIATDPNIGMPHNQMGTIAGNTNYGLDAVYHYMRWLEYLTISYSNKSIRLIFSIICKKLFRKYEYMSFVRSKIHDLSFSNLLCFYNMSYRLIICFTLILINSNYFIAFYVLNHLKEQREI